MRSATEMFMRERREKEGRFGTEDVKHIIVRFAQIYMTAVLHSFGMLMCPGHIILQCLAFSYCSFLSHVQVAQVLCLLGLLQACVNTGPQPRVFLLFGR